MSARSLWDKIKDIFTDLLGAVIMISTAAGVWWTHSIELLWNGVTGLVIGFIFLMIPDGTIITFLKNWAKKKF